MKTRKLALGIRNIVGARVTEARLRQGMKQNKLQAEGIEISIPALANYQAAATSFGENITRRVPP